MYSFEDTTLIIADKVEFFKRTDEANSFELHYNFVKYSDNYFQNIELLSSIIQGLYNMDYKYSYQ